ncbi:hypothetical protein CSAL01_10008 [Colletotrichum salicis]|uniref:Epoxide hydrolase N-terminal domain-containing protein n=1 Tax=Colletotrichum salicis TaxID=1209931 RepID=A0A135V150_9PEZI|nr:hypothetical protein CSAL01_10008 [Colletotrichum salicis]
MLLQRILWLSATAVSAQPSDRPRLNFNFPSNSEPQRFTIKVDESFLNNTIHKVRSYRPTHGLSSTWDIEGPPAKSLTDVAEYWGTQYDWNNVQKKMNDDFDHYATTVSGGDTNATPLLLLHGWPSTNLEWSKVIKPLSENSEQPFHIVAPDLPGFGFSPEPQHPGLGLREMGSAFDALMHQLGYEKYGIATTNLGWVTGRWMTIDVRDSILGHMCDFFLAEATTEDQA